MNSELFAKTTELQNEFLKNGSFIVVGCCSKVLQDLIT